MIVNYRYFISGGPEKYMFNIMNKLQKEGHEVVPFSIRSNKNMPTEYEKYFVDPIGGMDLVYYDQYKKTPKTIRQLLSRSFYSLEVKKAIQKMIRVENPDVVYILHFINKLSPSVIAGAKKMKKRVVVRLSDFFLLCPRYDFMYENNVCEDCVTKGYGSCIKKKCLKNSLSASLIRVMAMKLHRLIKIYDKVDAFVCPSKFLRDKLVEGGFPAEKMHHIETFTSDMPCEFGRVGKYGLFLGRLTEEKGLKYLVEAYNRLGQDYSLLVIGDDTTEEALEIKKYIAENNMKNVTFLGFQSGEELGKYILEARFVCVPSIWYENMPNVVLEAFASGKPVLAGRIGSMTELVQEGYNGFLFESKNSGAIAQCVKKLDADDLVMELGKNARKTFEDNHMSVRHYQKLMKVLSSKR